MMDFVCLEGTDGDLVWVRLEGHWGEPECTRLLMLLEELDLPAGSEVVLDFIGAGHLDFRMAPLLIHLGRGIEARCGRFRIAGLTDYLQHIMELGCALEGREFVEEHLWTGSTLRSRVFEECGATRLPAPAAVPHHSVVMPSLN